ncbi:PANK4 kinase, partial [Polypterus senegalus]
MAASGQMKRSSHSMDKSIILPPDEIFRNLENAKRFAIDIGGSLTKLAYYSTVQHKVAKVRSFDHTGKEAVDEPLYEISVQEEVTARLHFIKFENAYIETCLDFIKDHLVNTETKVIKATGGGAYKFKDLIEKKLQLKVDKEDEMSCLIKGCNFVLKNIPHEAFVYVKHADPEFRFQTTQPDIFPYLLVNIGSGVSIVKVESEDKFERIGGSSIGGGTFWGLGALLTNTKRFDELLQLASRGQHASVDMLVKDIYGGGYSCLGLTGDLIASSFGKSATEDREFSKADMAKSLLHMISNDIGQLACLYAKLHNLNRVYFGGFFIRGHPVTMHTITYSINFFTKVVSRAVASQPDLTDAKERAEKFSQKYQHKLKTLRQQPFAYGSLTVRSLLDTREHCLNEFNFPDPYSKIKQRENDWALKFFHKVVKSLESLNWEERQFSLVKGLLAGNVFDWGAKAVSDILVTDPDFGFEEAKQQLQERPWLIDTYNKWIERLKVILASNSGPALNDVTYSELQILTERIAAMDSVIHRLDKGLATVVRERHTDLVIIEGMGRAIHTNFYAALCCESLKLAVIKNSWLADRFGGKIFSVVFKYEQPCK